MGYSPAGGRRRRRSSKKFRGGSFHASTPMTGIARHASPISGIHSAKADYVGGKRRRSRKSKRSHRHTRQCKH